MPAELELPSAPSLSEKTDSMYTIQVRSLLVNNSRFLSLVNNENQPYLF